VAAIPEGLPAIVTVVLALGVQRMVKRNAIIKNLPAVETLGSASVICSDKTGTLTMNRMTLCRVWTEKDGIVELTPEISASVEETLLLGALCCDGTVNEVDGKEVLIGDPTETAIVRAAKQYGMTKDILAVKFPRIMELPFDSDRKLMTTVHSMNGKYYAVTKGAYDVIESRVEKDLSSAREATRMMSEQALRVLAVAIKELQELPEAPTQEALEYGLTLIGLVGMIDPARPEAKQAVSVCREAGIKPVMITGDHIVTASAIARELGILIDGDDAITGAELAAMTEEQLNERVRNISVYARVSPEDKIRIVKAWQKQGEVVAMTGDGVNDAPALKAADIGCAMGITGTDVAKGAADVTLTDDNFATIVEAVKEGRGIYENIKRVVGFLLGTNIGEIIVVFLSMLLWQESPLLSMQLLWINVVTDTLPAMALGVEPVKQGIMRFKPRKQSESLFANGYGVQIALQGVMFGLLSLAAFAIGLNTNIETARTMAFLTLAFSQTIHAFNMRSNESIFKIGVFGNKYLNLASLASIILVCAVSFIPALQSLFALTFLNGWQYLVVAAFTVTPIVVLEIAKALKIIKD
ncbi:MAG: cation-translocating P-type ATPase, partial [Clostridia bacterium]|nr:cation-translocating P-type ATPase [Clostridia bacterium]